MKTRNRKVQQAKQTEQIVEKNTSENEEADDAPEAVSWSTSKEVVLKEIEREKESITSTKKREKQVRIQKEERSRQLKEERKAKELSRLPQEILQKVATQQKDEDKESTLKIKKTLGEHLTFDSDNEDDLELADITPAAEFTHKGINILVLPKEAKKPRKIQTSASDFLQQQLYGDRIPRLSTLKAVSYKRKGRTEQPAVKFAKKADKPCNT